MKGAPNGIGNQRMELGPYWLDKEREIPNMSLYDISLTNLEEPMVSNMDLQSNLPLREAIFIILPGMATVPERGQVIMNDTHMRF
jgi:hypothetical protein